MTTSRYSRVRGGVQRLNIDSEEHAPRQRYDSVEYVVSEKIGGGGDESHQLWETVRTQNVVVAPSHDRLLSSIEENQDTAVNVIVSVTTMILFFCCMSSCFRWKGDARRNSRADAEKDEMDPKERKEYIEKHLRSLKVLTGRDAASKIAIPDSSDSDDSEATSESGTTASLEAEMPEFATNTTETTTTTAKESTAPQDAAAAAAAAALNVLEEGTEDVCAICLINYCDGDEICFSDNSQCEHTFHRECMVEWLQKHWDCPICRRPYLNDKESSP